ncbi:interferon alpha-2 [Dasypus novemcinctus]|uniref:Interferon 1GA1 n=1 Tax=Dasypus novemcinctus TaxID=9361 RepID=A0A7R8C3X2_DASNO|nr:interferon alpha-2-like [Dasypus novemcinctus]CAB0000531.1 TPA: interferon 1GA1 [Dasypus novemcinctus]
MDHMYLLLAGLMLCSSLDCSLGCPLPRSQGLESKEIFTLLRQMNRIPSHSCLNDRVDFKYPWKAETVTQIPKTQATCFSYEMFQQIFNLFQKENSRAAWDNSLLDELLSRLDHNLEQVEQMKVENLPCADLGTLVRDYLQGTDGYLNEKKYSSCAWEVVRGEPEMCFPLI